PSLGHVFCDRGLATIDPEFEQFAVNPWCSPQRVSNAHLENEVANVRRCLWPTAARSRSPAPVRSETGTMPTDYRLRLEDFQRVKHLGRQAVRVDWACRPGASLPMRILHHGLDPLVRSAACKDVATMTATGSGLRLRSCYLRRTALRGY